MVVGPFDIVTRYSLFDTFPSFLFCTRIWVFLGKDPAPFSLVDEPTNLLGNSTFLLYLQFFFVTFPYFCGFIIIILMLMILLAARFHPLSIQ